MKHDLSGLARFYQDHVDRALAMLIARHEPLLSDNEPLVGSLRHGLLHSYFELTYRALVGQYKLIERRVSFADYCRSLDDPAMRLRIKRSFPVLDRWMDILEHNWLVETGRLLTRWNDDRAEICALLGCADPDITISSIRLGLGDAHRHGRAVAMLGLSDGGRIIYKPRSLDIDTHFGQLIAWINSHSDFALRVPRHIARDGYGWAEFVAYESCATESDLAEYYRRLGALLCLLYVLEGNDFHYENIIAHGAQPMLVDLESFFHPRSPIAGAETNEGIDTSVLHTGILPNSINTDDALPDISGIADVEGKDGIVERLALIQDDDGNLVFERARGKLIGAQNVPMLDGRKVDFSPALQGHFGSGFATLYKTLLDRRAELLGMIPRFLDDEVRVLFRPTIVYSHILDEARHPAILLSGDHLARHLAVLSDMSIDYQTAYRFIGYEMASLERRDIPLFTARVGSRDLYGEENESIEDFFVLSGYEAVEQKIARLAESDMARQLWIITQALGLKESARVELATTRDPVAASSTRLSDRLLGYAANVADYIVGHVHQDDDTASWIVTKSMSEDNQNLAIANAFYDLYSGMPGEILFLDRMGRTAARDDWRNTAAKAFRFLDYRVREAHYSIRPLGLFAGWGSILYLLSSLARTSGDDDYRNQAEQLFARVDFGELIAVDHNFGLVKGAAGFMLACADHHRAFPSEAAAALAKQAAAHLVAHRRDSGPGVSWRIASAEPLSGLAHGASGFAMAFARMYAAFGDPVYRDLALEAIEYERSLFVPEQGNWRDCRDYVLKQQGPVCATSWAHGAPGIGLARLALLDAGIDEPRLREELDIATETTLRYGIKGQSSLVYGDFGNLELPIRYAEQIGDQYWSETRDQIEQALDHFERRGAQLDDRRHIPLGLMSGITGIGYQCLRIVENTSTLSILAMNGQLPSRRLDLD